MADKKVPAAKNTKLKASPKADYESQMVKGKGNSKMTDVSKAKKNEGFDKKKKK
jgi:hypothetical protein